MKTWRTESENPICSLGIQFLSSAAHFVIELSGEGFAPGPANPNALSEVFRGQHSHSGPRKATGMAETVKKPKCVKLPAKLGVVPVLQRLLVPRLLCSPPRAAAQHPPGSHPAPSPACQFPYRLASHEKSQKGLSKCS